MKNKEALSALQDDELSLTYDGNSLDEVVPQREKRAANKGGGRQKSSTPTVQQPQSSSSSSNAKNIPSRASSVAPPRRLSTRLQNRGTGAEDA